MVSGNGLLQMRPLPFYMRQVYRISDSYQKVSPSFVLEEMGS